MRARGFTLVEVMVALAIVAIALPALLMSLYQQVDDTGYLRDKSMAFMVAANKLAELRIVTDATERLEAGKDSGPVQMADRDWYWWLETKPTEVEQFFRIEIKVASGEAQAEQPLYTLVAFMSGDLRTEVKAGTGQGQGSKPEKGEKTAPPAGGQPGINRATF